MAVSKKVRMGLVVFFGVTALFAVFFGNSFQKKDKAVLESPVLKNATVTFKNAIVKVEVADTEALRERGLSGRASLPEGGGMWFVYQKSSLYSFWMPDMHFSIDIIWFDENFRSVYFQENAMPESYPGIFTPDALARYVLEVPAGFVKKYGVSLGDKVSVSDIHS